MLRERASRQKAFLKATIRFQNRSVTMDCVVRDISISGAKLEIHDSFTLPPEFELEIPQRGAILRCRLVWRTEGAAGVKFEDSSAAKGDALGEARMRIEALERENAALKREIGRLTALLQ
jgi:hypothetical protein